ncbi:MAG TPA: class I lanthipeptide [Kofleriaceae bacterium]|jgi:hypothetical protein|nr:class I lanthipeptide [Kofleriaceae bacterium]
MKKIKPIAKLTLHAQTLRELTADQLGNAAGGSNEGSCTCTNNSCLLHACKLN